MLFLKPMLNLPCEKFLVATKFPFRQDIFGITQLLLTA